MNDAAVVGRFERFADLLRDGEAFWKWKRTLCDAIGERPAFDELEDQKLAALDLLESVDGADVRMVERGEQLRLAPEARHALRIVDEARWQCFQRDITIQPRVARAIDLAHPSDAEQRTNLVGPQPGSRREGHV